MKSRTIIKAIFIKHLLDITQNQTNRQKMISKNYKIKMHVIIILLLYYIFFTRSFVYKRTFNHSLTIKVIFITS